MSQVMLARNGDSQLTKDTSDSMFRLRHTVFHDRLKWEVNSENGMERDVFDQGNPVYVLVRNENKQVEGCWRLLPTLGPYMLKDVFPQLLHGQPVPRHKNIWELSRFAVSSAETEGSNFGFNETPVRMMQRAFEFAKEHGIESYVTVTTVAVERLIRSLGIAVHRFGPPMRIGRVMTVGCWIDIDSQTEAAVYGQPGLLAQEAA